MVELIRSSTEVDSQRFITRVYGWMTVGMVVTGLVSMMTASSPALLSLIIGNRIVFYGLMIAELFMVIGLSRALPSLSLAAASGLFVSYAALNGLTMSFIFLLYTASSIATTFFVAAGMFGCMAVIGSTTEKDLTGIGSLCVMGVIGLVLASIANIFVKNSALGLAISYAGVALFVGLTAYDAQKIKQMASDGDESSSRPIYGALRLYLDFVNLFLYLLRFTGRRRQ